MKNKLFKKILTFAILCCMGLCLVACTGDIKTPDSNAEIIGNGGLAVQKGNYLYYVNGYNASTTITKDNRKKDDYVRSGLYVAKVDDNGNIVTDAKGNATYNKRMVGNIVGFEKTDLRIYGDYLYYTTPCTNLNSDGGSVANTLIKFCRIRLDGKKQTTLYTSSTDSVQYNYYYDGSRVNLILLDDSKLINVTTDGATTIDTDVTSVALPEVVGNQMKNDSYANIFYTRSLADDDNVDAGNKLMRLNAKTNKTEIIAMTGDSWTAKGVTSKYVYVGLGNYIYKISLSDLANGQTITSAYILANKATSYNYSNVYYLVNDNSNSVTGLIVVRDNNVYFLEDGSTSEQAVVENATIISIAGGHIYYKDSNSNRFSRINIKGSEKTVDILYSGDMTATFDSAHIDVQTTYNGSVNNIYMLLEHTNDNGSSTYLYDVNLNERDDENKFVVNHVGVYESADKPKKKEDDK